MSPPPVWAAAVAVPPVADPAPPVDAAGVDIVCVCFRRGDSNKMVEWFLSLQMAMTSCPICTLSI